MIEPNITDDIKMDERLWALYKIVAGTVTFQGRLFKCEMRDRPPLGVHLFVPKQDLSVSEAKLLSGGKMTKEVLTSKFVRRALVHDGWEPETDDTFRHTFKSVYVTSMDDGEWIVVDNGIRK